MSEILSTETLLNLPPVRDLLVRAARKGSVSYAEINDVLADLLLDEEAVEILLEALERRSIAVTDELPSDKPEVVREKAPRAVAAPAERPASAGDSEEHDDLDALLAELDELIPTDYVDVMSMAGDAGEELEDEMAPVEDALRIYLNRMGQVPRLSHEEERELALKIQNGTQEEREDARRKLVEGNLRLVVHLARAAAPRTALSITDLLQEGNLGLIDAAERYTPRGNKTFGSYATWYIRRSLNRAINEHSRMLRLSGELYAAIQKMQTAQRELTQRFQRPPTRQEIADHTGLTVSQIEEAQRAAVRPLSLDAPVGSDDDRTEFGENLADPESERVSETSTKRELQESLVRMLGDLSEREKAVIQMRFGIGDYADTGAQSTEDVAAELKISRERVQELEKRGIRKMRKKARGSGLERLLGADEDEEDEF